MTAPRPLILVTSLLLTLIVLSCTPDAQWPDPTQNTAEMPSTYHLLESFERPGYWSVGGDYAEMHYTPAGATTGKKALQLVTAEAVAGRKIPLAGELPLDLSNVRSLRVDVSVEGPPVDLQLDARSRRGTYFVLDRLTGLTGTRRDVTLQTVTPDTSEGLGSPAAWSGQRDRIETIFLNVIPRGSGPLTVSLDNLRADRPSFEVLRSPAPEILEMTASDTRVDRYDKIELTLKVAGRTTNPFDPTAGLDIRARFISPQGTSVAVPAFLYKVEDEKELGSAAAAGVEAGRFSTKKEQSSARPVVLDAAGAVWKVRFTPTEPGRWSYEVEARSGKHRAVSDRGSFECVLGNRPGFVRVSPRDPRAFETDTGTPYLPLGQNVGWAGNYEHYLKKIESYSGTVVRVWMCPWNLTLEPKHTPGWYDLAEADKLDRLVELARRKGIRIQLVLLWHDSFGNSFSRTPYNMDHGGPCITPEGFFYLRRARNLFKRRLRYIVARWGYSPAILSWELFNEVDLTRYRHVDDVVNWHREMARYLDGQDPNNHMVTTSLSNSVYLTELARRLWSLQEIDYLQGHIYRADVTELVRLDAEMKRRWAKPYFLAEFGRGYYARDEMEDPIGATLHAGLWTTAVANHAGVAMPWWWDTYIDPRGYYDHFARVSRFLKDHDPRETDLRPIDDTLRQAGADEVRVVGSLGRTRGMLWVYAPRQIETPKAEVAAPMLADSAQLTCKGMVEGRYKVRVYDCWQGKWISEKEVDSYYGGLRITLPASRRDVAVRIEPVKENPPRVEIETNTYTTPDPMMDPYGGAND